MWKVVAGISIGGTTLGTIVVMLGKKPRTDREWAIAIISSAVCSLGGGAAIIDYFALKTQSFINALALGGLFFACALPGWFLVRVAFNTINRLQDKTAMEVADEVKKVLP